MADRASVMSVFLASLTFAAKAQVIPADLNSCLALYQLDSMTQCVLGWSYSQYRTHGCACSGLVDIPVDGIDSCCKTHNECYDQILITHECTNPQAPYYCMYHYECESDHHKITCKDNKNTCQRKICDCDSSFVQCLKKFPQPDAQHPVACEWGDVLFGRGRVRSNVQIQGGDTLPHRIAP